MSSKAHPLPAQNQTADPANYPDHSALRANAIAFLIGRINYEHTPILPYAQRHLKLERMRQVLTCLDNPDAGIPIIHVAGTKGKGSTSALLGEILQQAGYRTGLFSSPHLDSIEERFAVNSKPCSADQLVALVDRLRPVVEAMDRQSSNGTDHDSRPTYFELTTAMALMHFAQQKVDVAILEVGMGGRLDSTNVCMPTVTVITSISLDHTQQLGNTLVKIATEKAGIIKPGVPLLCGAIPTEPRQTIARMASARECRMMVAGVDFQYQYQPPSDLEQADGYGRLDFQDFSQGEEIKLENASLQLHGKHQAANAALATAIAMELRRQQWRISDDAIRRGLLAATLPARIEVLARHPTVVLDVAHNVASADALIQTLGCCFACRQDGPARAILVLAVSQDKDVRGILRVLLPHFQTVIATEYHENPRALPASQLARLIHDEQTIANPSEQGSYGDKCQVLSHHSAIDAWQRASRLASPNDLICITGSFFIATELRKVILTETSSAAAQT
jgi:dihydrofolate synthase / folylpolyglutamate synthase